MLIGDENAELRVRMTTKGLVAIRLMDGPLFGTRSMKELSAAIDAAAASLGICSDVLARAPAIETVANRLVSHVERLARS